MLTTEPKVHPDSDYYLYTPGRQAQRAFLYPLIVGYFQYEPGYSLKRQALDSFLLIYIKAGSCTVHLNGRSYTARADQIIFLDCYAPHGYSTTEGYIAEWIHFDGVNAREYFDMAVTTDSPVITLKDTFRFTKYLRRIYRNFKEGASLNEAIWNNDLVNIMTELLTGQQQVSSGSGNSTVTEDAIAYINRHFVEDISLEQLAAEVSLSPFYFSRLFKKETGFSPHGYIIATRINNARYLLKTTCHSIKDICYSSGFSSESRFCSAFKKVTGMTPSEYRQSEKG